MYSNQINELKGESNKSEEVSKEQSASSAILPKPPSIDSKFLNMPHPLTLERTPKLKSSDKSSLSNEYFSNQADESPYQVKTFDEALEEAAKLGLNLDDLLELYPTAEGIIEEVNHQLKLNTLSNSKIPNPNLLNTAHSLKVDVPEVLKMAQELGVSPNEALESAITEMQTANCMNQKIFVVDDKKGPYKKDDFQNLKTDQKSLVIDVNAPLSYPNTSTRVDIDGLAHISINQFYDLRQKELFQELLTQGLDQSNAYAIAQAKFGSCILKTSTPRSDVATDGEEETNLAGSITQEDYFPKCAGADTYIEDSMDI